MLGFVSVLASALLGIVLIFIIMLVSFIQAQMVPTEGDYKLEYDSGLAFPIDSFLLTEEISKKAMEQYFLIKGIHDITLATTCTYGGRLDRFTASRYATYNYVFTVKELKDDERVAKSMTTPPTRNTKSNRCYLYIDKYIAETENEEVKLKNDKDD